MDKIKIIIADDHIIFLRGLETLLRRLTTISKIMQASNGREVLDLLQKDSYDIVFMDIRMPVMGGIEATSEIKDPATKVIALTMDDDRLNIVRMFKSGASAYLMKNTTYNEIQEAMSKVLSGQRYYARNMSELLLRT